jgi:1-acyl-sn-glycerol-3-phosphate acyltransferase
MSSQLDRLTQINLDELVSSFGWVERPVLASILRRSCTTLAREFARQMAEFDNAVGERRLCAAATEIVRRLYVREVRIYGGEDIPSNGPVLFLSNHPGMTDTLSLLTAINRPDLKVVALRRPFLVSLENTVKQCFLVSEGPGKRINVIRQISRHLRHGGSALSFPAGEIEPDPRIYPGALEALDHWADSVGLFTRFAPETTVVPVLVSGVIWEKTAYHWATRLKRTRPEREKLAAALQLLAMIARELKPTTIHIRFAKAISVGEIGPSGPADLHKVVISRMRGLIQTEAAAAVAVG